MRKIKRIKVETEKGDRYLVFRPVMEPSETLDCIKLCPYGEKICTALRNPRDPENPKSCFADFCGNLGILDEDDKELKDYIPVKGTLEQVLPDFDSVYQEIIKGNGYVQINDIIDSICDGSCGLYREDHKNCSPSNSSCILQDLLQNCEYDPSLEGKEKEAGEKEES